MVARRQARQRDLFQARAGVARPGQFQDLLGAAVPDVPLGAAGLAEPAQPRAAAHHLDVDPVVDDLGVGHDRPHGEGRLFQVRHAGGLRDRRQAVDLGRERRQRAVIVPRRLDEAGGVEEVELAGEGHDEVGPGRAGLAQAAVLIEEEGQGVLGLAQEHEVEERGHRLGVIDARAAGDDQRVGLGSVGGQQRNARQVQHLQDVRVKHLVLEGDAENVEVADRTARFPRKEGDVRRAHARRHVRPGGVGALAEHIAAGVQEVVEDGRAQVAHADGVGVGEPEAEADGDAVPGFADRADLSADVLGGVVDERQEVPRDAVA